MHLPPERSSAEAVTTLVLLTWNKLKREVFSVHDVYGTHYSGGIAPLILNLGTR